MLDKSFDSDLAKLMKDPPEELLQHLKDNFMTEDGKVKRNAMNKFLEEPGALSKFIPKEKTEHLGKVASYSSDKETAKKIFKKYKDENPGTRKDWTDFYRAPEKDSGSKQEGSGGDSEYKSIPTEEIKAATSDIAKAVKSSPPNAKQFKNKLKKFWNKGTQFKNKAEREDSFKTSTKAVGGILTAQLALTALSKSKKVHNLANTSPKLAGALILGAVAASAVAGYKATRGAANKAWDIIEKENDAKGDPFEYWEDSNKAIDQKEFDESKQSKMASSIAERFLAKKSYDDQALGAGRLMALKDRFRRIYTELRFIAQKTISFLKGLRDRAKPMEFQYNLDMSKFTASINKAIKNLEKYLRQLGAGMDSMRVAYTFEDFKGFLSQNLGKILAGLGALGTFFILSKNYLQYPLQEEAFDELKEMEKHVNKLQNVPTKLHETSEILVASIPPSKELRNVPREIKKSISEMDKDAKRLYEITDPWGELATSFIDIKSELNKLKQQTKVYTG